MSENVKVGPYNVDSLGLINILPWPNQYWRTSSLNPFLSSGHVIIQINTFTTIHHLPYTYSIFDVYFSFSTSLYLYHPLT